MSKDNGRIVLDCTAAEYRHKLQQHLNDNFQLRGGNRVTSRLANWIQTVTFNKIR